MGGLGWTTVRTPEIFAKCCERFGVKNARCVGEKTGGLREKRFLWGKGENTVEKKYIILGLCSRTGHEIAESNFQSNSISDYPSDLTGFRLSEVVRWTHSGLRAATHRLPNKLEGLASKFMFRG